MSKVMTAERETIEFSNGRKFVFRKQKIADYNLAAKSASRSASDQFSFQIAMAGELLKLLLVEVDGEPLDARQRENLDSVMSVEEYNALLGVMQETVGKLTVKSREFSK